MNIEFDSLESITLAVGVINTEGRNAINCLLNSLGLPFLPGWWDWRTRVGGKGEYVGSFPKRVAKYYYQKSRFKIDSDDLGRIGQMMNEHTNSHNQYLLDFTKDFGWSAGDFGDDGSCFWSCHSGAKDSILDGGGFAVRFYDEDGDGDGIEGTGRAWIIPMGGYHVIFNGTGLETSDVARIVAHHWGQSYRRISLTNQGTWDGLVYINGGVGFVVGPESVVNGMNSADLDLDIGLQCDCCDCSINEDDSYGVDTETLCEECFHNTYTHCQDCGETCLNDDITEVDVQNGCEYLCEYCRDKDYTLCEDCNTWKHDSQVSEVNGCEVCNDCLEDYTFCEDCETYHKEGVEYIGDRAICSDCVEPYTCEACGDTHLDTRPIHGTRSCPDCADEVEEKNTPLFRGVLCTS